MEESRKLHNRDRLTELPDSLLIAILSLLQMRDAVRTSVLSKHWIDCWTSVPSLNFSYHREDDLDRYRSFVYGALLRWKGAKILSFSLSFSGTSPPSRDLDSWLLFAIGKQVEELHFSGNPPDYYCPPQRLYSCSSIRELTLSRVKLGIPENTELSQLTSLTLINSSVSEVALTRLLSGAPVLEELTLMDIKNVKIYNIRSEILKKLQLRLWLCSALRIWAPNLSTLEIRGDAFVIEGFSLDVHIPSLTTAIVRFGDFYLVPRLRNFEDLHLLGMFGRLFQGICHAQTLTLSVWCIKCLLFLKKQDKWVEFSNAKYLKLKVVDEAADEMLLGVVEMFPKLLTLIVGIVADYTPPEDGYSFSSSEKKTDTPLRHLKTCDIRLPRTLPPSKKILRAIETVLENGEVLEKIVLRLLKYHEEALGTLEKVLSMRRSSPKARVIISK